MCYPIFDSALLAISLRTLFFIRMSHTQSMTIFTLTSTNYGLYFYADRQQINQLNIASLHT
jgi:hypothetical protein